MTRKRIFFVILSCACLLLQGCMNAAVTGAQTVYNRHSLQKTFKDQYITMQIFKGLNIDSKEFKDANISVATCNGDVLLAGQVPQKWQIAKATEIAKSVPDVKQVYNLVSIASPSSSLIKMSDAWLTAKVKGKLIASNDVDASQIKVVTENGTVYLMGILPPEQAETAVDITRSTDGVERVVKIFSYLTVSKHIVMPAKAGIQEG